MKLAERFLDTFQERWDRFEQQLETCRNDFSETAVHDLRVAIRRLVACIDMARALDTHPRLKKVRRVLKEQIDGLDSLRDCQVMQVEVAQALQEYPELEPLQPILLAREQKLLRKAGQQIKDFDLSRIEKRRQIIHSSLQKQLTHPRAEAELLNAVDQAFATALKRYNQIDPARPATIHRLRLAFKKLRYMAEIIHPALPGFPEKQLKRMQAYQSRMGDVQDAESFMQLLDKFKKKKTTADLEPARRYFDLIHAERIAAYQNKQGELLEFWRPAPDQPFPWQGKSKPKGAS